MKILMLLLTAALLSTAYAQNTELRTVPTVDLKRYAGLWYEIAKIPNRFQNQCVKNTTAQYTVTASGEILVVNSCIDEDGGTDKTEGIARIVDTKTNAKLQVSFFSILGFRPIWGDYWIIGLGENYDYAVVGTPSRKYGWILSRTKTLSKETMERINTLLRNQGYSPESFVGSPQ